MSFPVEAAARLCRFVLGLPLGFKIQHFVARVLLRLAADFRPRGVVSTLFGFRMHVDPRDFIQRFVFVFGSWEPTLSDVFRRQLKPGDGFVDIGANVGYFSLLAGKQVGSTGFGWSFEVDSDIHDQLRRNLSLNDMTNVEARHQGVFKHRQTLYVSKGDISNSGLTSAGSEVSAGAEAVEAIPLDELAGNPNTGRVRLVKIDVEGAEKQVLEGMQEFLRKAHPDVVVAVEIAPDRMNNGMKDAREIFAMMGRNGFRAYALENDYQIKEYIQPQVPAKLTFAETPLLRQSDYIFSRSGNFLA